MADILDVSLDDIVKQNNIERRKQRDRGRNKPRNNRSEVEPYPSRKRAPSDAKWKHDKFESYDRQAQANKKSNVSEDQVGRFYKVKVIGISQDIASSELKELFGAVGPIHHVNIIRNQRVAIIAFLSKKSAMNAVELYNAVSLDGSAKKIQVEYIVPIDEKKPRIVETQHKVSKLHSKTNMDRNEDIRKITVNVL